MKLISGLLADADVQRNSTLTSLQEARKASSNLGGVMTSYSHGTLLLQVLQPTLNSYIIKKSAYGIATCIPVEMRIQGSRAQCWKVLCHPPGPHQATGAKPTNGRALSPARVSVVRGPCGG